MQSLVDAFIKLGSRLVPSLIVFAVALAAGRLAASLVLAGDGRGGARPAAS